MLLEFEDVAAVIEPTASPTGVVCDHHPVL